MENCFRFLINVDQCLNMSYFDMFFYKLESQHKFHMNSVQLFDASDDSSLRSAISDIRMYLNKYPYHVGNYQIIVAMRTTFQPNVRRWEETMLYRLLRLDLELRRARILINSQEQTEKALNLIMLYESDFSAELSELSSYKDSGRLQADCRMLLQQLSLPEGTVGQQELEQAFAACFGQSSPEDTAAQVMADFVQTRRKNTEHMQLLSQHMDQESAMTDSSIPLCEELTGYIRNRLFHFQIFEKQIDRNSRRQQTLALLRVTEFINMSTELSAQAAATPLRTPLVQRCTDNWQRIWQDDTLEQRYADMLLSYRARLNAAASELESPKYQVPSAKSLPVEAIPAEDAISSEEGFGSEKSSQDQSKDLKAVFGKVLEKNRMSLSSMHSDWKEAYTHARQVLDQMEYKLKTHAETLSRQYAAALELRKQDSLAWRTGFYVSAPDTEADISRLSYEREQRLQQLKSPQMSPSLSFNDQLNMEEALEKANSSIELYLRCLKAVTAGNFLLLILTGVVMSFGHYTFLQPYVFGEAQTAACYFAYLAAILILMLLCWVLPHNYFRRRLKSRILSLQEDVDKYISGYYVKAEQFTTYINLLNQLDYINRYHQLLVRAHTATHKLSQGYLWHKVQVRQHLSKLQFFQGLVDLGRYSDEANAESFVPGIDGDQVCDFVDSQLYWPQG